MVDWKVCVLALGLSFNTPVSYGSADDIRLNQIGYYPKSVKKFVAVDSTASEFEVRDLEDGVKYRGPLVDQGVWKLSDERVRVGDFSALQTPGKYRIVLSDKGPSHPFEIRPDLYAGALKAALKSFYFQRASTDLTAQHAGKYARPMGHPDTTCRYHPSSGRSEGVMSSPKGWYDAGDYNKYVTNAGVTLGTLLSFHELYPEAFPDGSLGIPESGNGISDLLDEVRYELDWLLTMQDEDGGVFYKLTSKGFCGFVMPHEDRSERFVVGKSTTSALNFAANAAQAARVYRRTDPSYARRLQESAERAWLWAKTHNNVPYDNPPDVVTGAYSHRDFSKDFFFAACELLVTTGQEEYVRYVRQNLKDVQFEVGESWRNYLRNLGSYSVVNIDNPLGTVERTRLRNSVVALADQLLSKVESIPYRIALDDYQWGSSSDVCNQAIVLALAFRYSKNRKYLDGLIEVTDYLFGKNATSYCLVTGFGSKSPQHIHHRPSQADGIAEPIPGFLAGGPNAGRHDARRAGSATGVVYPNLQPARSYVDLVDSYASNEVAINWNAPLVYVLGFIEANQAQLGGAPKPGTGR